jgi:spermidine/putrescine-binding protein
MPLTSDAERAQPNWTCGLVHMANSPAPDDLVYDFLNAMTAPETGKYMIEQYNYGHANRKAFDISDKAQLESLAFTEPQKLFQTGVFETEVTAEMEQRRNKILEDVRLGL